MALIMVMESASMYTLLHHMSYSSLGIGGVFKKYDVGLFAFSDSSKKGLSGQVCAEI